MDHSSLKNRIEVFAKEHIPSKATKLVVTKTPGRQLDPFGVNQSKVLLKRQSTLYNKVSLGE